MRATVRVLLVLCLAVAVACETESGDPAAGADVRADQGGGTDAVASCEAVAEGQTFLFETLVLEYPDAEAMTMLLNDVWAADIAAGRLVFLYHLDAFEPATGGMVQSVGAGDEEEGTYAFSQAPQTAAAELDGCRFGATEETIITLDTPTTNIPIPFVEATVHGTFTEGASAITDGRLFAAVRRTDVEALTFQVPGLGETALAPLFDAAEIPLEIDLDDDGTLDAYRVEGSYTARRLAPEELR